MIDRSPIRIRLAARLGNATAGVTVAVTLARALTKSKAGAGALGAGFAAMNVASCFSAWPNSTAAALEDADEGVVPLTPGAESAKSAGGVSGMAAGVSD